MKGASRQIALALDPVCGRLFSRDFLGDRLPTWPEWDPDSWEPLRQQLVALWAAERESLPGANEAQTEERFVKPVLAALGFSFTVQAGLAVAGGRRQPDYALFVDEAARLAAEALEGRARYEHASAVADAKRFDRPLDRRERAGAHTDDPVAQIINYVSITGRDWGVLTNGRMWRLYAREGDLIEGAFYEVDLVALLEADEPAAFGLFAALFSASALRRDASGRCLLDRVLSESRANAVHVGDELSRQVFAAVPALADGLLGEEARTAATLAVAYDHSLVLLYRLLFCLYAEARELLPVANPHYVRYSLREQRERLAHDLDHGRVFSSRSDDLYNDLLGLFAIVERGDDALGVNEYDGGLFSAAAHPYFAGRSVPDQLLGPALDRLYRVGGQQVDYAALSPRHLGTIYERLLDYRLEEDAAGRLILVSATGRRESGSYYTPDFIVDRIVETTLEPRLRARSAAIADVGLTGIEALEHFLELRVLDPAMGSGHFLVAAAEYIAVFIATDPSFDGELNLPEIRRLVAERCLYGVDLNPMAVELARLSLWLTTVRGDEPLTFLANLREGNSLVGARLDELLAGGDGLFAQQFEHDARDLLARIDEIRTRESRSGVEVHAKQRIAAVADELRAPLEGFADETLRPRFSSDVGRFFHWELEFPEVFLAEDGGARDDAGFDAVIGNPPYVRIQALGRELADYCRAAYATASGSFDLYVPFIERSVRLLSPAGRLGFIVPNKLLKLDYAKRLRAWFAAERMVEEIVDFGDAQLFAGATNYTCMLQLDRAGRTDFGYRRVSGALPAVRNQVAHLERAPAESYAAAEFGAEPWVLATGEKAALLRTLADGAERLGDVTSGVFTGLQTSADPIYLLEDRGWRGGRRLVYSRSADRELELEPDLLHPLASGPDVGRYAFAPLRTLLLFPYRRTRDAMALLRPGELEALPATAAYLREHEELLRARESGKMDHDDWYAFGRTQSLGAHDLPKLGVAATVRHLEVAADPAGAVYFHNVRVNGILPREGGPSIWTLLVLLNSRLLDWVFRRGAAELANGYYAANKQFIAGLPIRPIDAGAATALDTLGQGLHETAAAIEQERAGFLGWLEDFTGARARDLAGSTMLLRYDDHPPAAVLDVLRANRARVGPDPDARSTRERIEAERAPSVGRLADLRATLRRVEHEADAKVEGLYGLSVAQRQLLAADDAGAARHNNAD